MNNNNDNYWYNVKQENGNTVIEKVDSNGKVENNNNNNQPNGPYEPPKNVDRPLSSMSNANVQPRYPYYQQPPRKKSKIGLVLVLLVIVVAAGFFAMTFFTQKERRSGDMKRRTFMIYMVGSDLESGGSMATYDLSDIKGENINLQDYSVVLMVGGSKKWHNFVNVDEIGIYELESDGFKKKKSLPVSSMGLNSSLTTFLDYSYNNYPAEKYDMIFWNHGLGALGLELDEVKDDFLDIKELSEAFKQSPFSDEKLELVIFNNCLAGNLHFANIMSNYAEYMVGSEEVMYVGMIIDRLNFLEDVSYNDDGYDIGKKYIKRSDESMKKINSLGRGTYDTTLSIIDLSKVKSLDSKVNKFFKSIDLDSNYYNIAKARMRTYTYAKTVNYAYDTVDLYELVDELTPYSNNKSAATNLKKEIKNTVKYNSALNNHSNGISIYFPYYGNTTYVENHLYYFGSLWKNDYTSFISNFYDTNSSTRRARRAVTGSDINELTNDVKIKGNKITIELTDEEKENFQRANIYVFDKNNNTYSLLLKSNNVVLNENTLSYNHYGLLKTANNNYLTLVDKDGYKVYEGYNDSDLVTNIQMENGKVSFLDSVIDSGDNPSGGIFTKENDEIDSLYLYNYELVDQNKINAEWLDTLEKQRVEVESADSLTIDESLSGHYVLIEMYDINNDIFYSKIVKVK